MDITPTPGYGAIYGDWNDIPRITPEQRAQLWDAARACDKTPKKEQKRPCLVTTTPPHTFPGDSVADYLRANLDIIRQALTRAGWVFLYAEGDFEQWQRPNQPQANKPGGSLNIKDGYFHCFTSNAAPLDVETNYSPLQLIAALEFGGDISMASKAYAPKVSTRRKACLDANNAPYFQSLEMTAEKVEYSEKTTAAGLRALCVQRQWERLMEEATNRALASLNEIDVDELNATFPINAAPAEVQNIAKKLSKRDKLPYAPIVQTGLAILGGVLGCYKVNYLYDNKPIYPLLHSFLIGEKGAGKTTIVESFLAPIEKEFDARWAEYWDAEKTKLSWLNAEISRLDKELEQTKNDDPRFDEIIKEKRPLEAQRTAIEWGGQRLIVSGDASFESLWYQSYIDRCVAISEKKKQIGKINSLGDASSKLKNSRNAAGGMTPSDYWAMATKVMDFSEKPKKAIGDKGRGTAKAGAVFLFDAQPGACYFIDLSDLLVKGFDRRFLWDYVPKRKRDKKGGKIDLTKEQEDLVELVEKILRYQGGDLECGYEKEYTDWYDDKMMPRINKAQDDGDAELESFLGTLADSTIHKLALILHVCEHVKRGDVPKTIRAETFKNAAQLIEIFIREYKLTWQQMRIAVDAEKAKERKKRTHDDPISKPFEKLSRKSRTVYKIIRDDEQSTQNGDDRALAIKSITDRNRPYQDLLTRKAIDDELFNAGFMYIDPETNKRVALPIYTLDAFSAELVETTQEETPAPENDPAQAPIDSAPEVDVSLIKSAEGASQSMRDDYTTFSEFDRYGGDASAAGEYGSDDEEVPF